MNIVLNCDCMAFMRAQVDCFTIQGRKWDFKDVLAIVDPPYGIGDFTMKTSGGAVKGKCAAMQVNWNGKIPDKKYFAELKRISKQRIIWGANYYNCFENGGAIIWYKNTGHSSLSQCEIASISFQRKVDYFPFKKLTGFCAPAKYIHPCQKPVVLYKWLLKKYARPGQLIFDSHVGSGSLRIACHDMGFDFVGCELDYDYWKAQEERYKNHIANQELIPIEEIQGAIWGQKIVFDDMGDGDE